jgi:hypothetical protein
VSVGSVAREICLSFSYLGFQKHSLTRFQINQLYLTGKGGNLVEFKGVNGMAAQRQSKSDQRVT